MPDAPEPVRAVFDTNILISSFYLHGLMGDLWEHVEVGTVSLTLSPFILGEFTGVLKRGFGLPAHTVERLVDEVLAHARLVTPTTRLAVVKAKDADNRILECAVDAGASVLVTGDLKHLRPLGRCRGVAILTPAEFRRLHLLRRS
ncbi:MAG: putative toxin-antitoxin system toxin component, PIN family [bacterium]